MVLKPQLEKLSFWRMAQLEFGQFVKTQIDSINKLPPGTITDPGLQASINRLLAKSESFDQSLVKIKKSAHTDRIIALDLKRDASIVALAAAIKLSLRSDDPAELEAAERLDTVFSTYGAGDMAGYNYEKESNAIGNLVEDLETKFKNQADLAGIGRYITRLKNDNAAFKEVFNQRIDESSSEPLLDAREERKALSEAYDDFTGYLLYNAKVQGTPQFTQLLSAINATRKYYADLLAKRKGRNGGEDEGIGDTAPTA